MSKEHRSQVFKSGNSLALRLPKALGLEEGTEMAVREEHGRYSFEPVRQVPPRIYLTGIYGSIPGTRPLTPDERTVEDRELDWGGRLLRGD